MITYTTLNNKWNLAFIKHIPKTVRSGIGLLFLISLALLVCIVVLDLYWLLAVFVIIAVWLVVTFDRLKWRMFALENGWTITANAYSNLPPSLRAVGLHQKSSEVVVANIEGVSCETYWYSFTDVNTKKHHKHLIGRIQLKENYPHIIINSKHNDGGAHRLQHNARKVPIDDEFDQDFELYVDKQEYQKALAIVYPDVLRAAQTASFHEDIEIDDSHLFFIITVEQHAQAELELLFASVAAIGKEIVEGYAGIDTMKGSSAFIRLLLK